MPQAPSSSQSDPPEIPEAPPLAMRDAYLRLSWSYIYWCGLMLAWAMACVAYFIITDERGKNRDNIIIGLALGALMLAMIAMPTLIFGGRTWHKRLGWITILLPLFSLMFIYPTATVIAGIVRRIIHVTRGHAPPWTDYIHLALGLLTAVLHLWTIRLSLRAVTTVQKLARGEYGT